MSRATCRRHARRNERGAAALLAPGLAAVVLFLALAVALVGRLVVDQRRAAVAADLAALAGATAVQHDRDACAAVSALARRNGATVVSCEVRGEVVRVRVSVDGLRALGRTWSVRAGAVAGPR